MHQFLDGFEAERADLTQQLTASSADVRSVLDNLTKLQHLSSAAAPDAAALQTLKDELQYKLLQTDNSATTSVRRERGAVATVNE